MAVVFVFLWAFSSCEMQRLDTYATFDNLKTLEEVVFLKKDNPELFVDSRGIIDEKNKRVTLYVPPQLNLTGSDLDSTLIPTFTIRGYENISIAGQPVSSGKTAVPFFSGSANPNPMTITSEDGSTENWELILIEELRVEIFTDDPRTNPTKNKLFSKNQSFSVYVRFNAPVDLNSGSVDDLTTHINNINSSQFIAIVITDLNAPTQNLFKVDLSVPLASTAFPATLVNQNVFNFSIQTDGVDDIDTGAIARNINSANVEIAYDVEAPNDSGLHPAYPVLDIDRVGSTFLDLRIRHAEDNFSQQKDIKYSVYYTSGSTTNVDDGTILDNTNYQVAGTLLVENLRFSQESTVVPLTGLNPDHYYHIFVAFEDQAGNVGTITEDEVFYTQDAVYVRTSGDDGTLNGNRSQPFASLQPALDYAFLRKIREVRVAEGIYFTLPAASLPSINETQSIRLYPDMQIYGGYNNNFSTRNPDIYDTIISGDINLNQITLPTPDFGVDDNNSNHLIFHPAALSYPPNELTLLDGFKLVNGGDNTATGGAAIYSEFPFRINNCVFYGNHSTAAHGGAVLFENIVGLIDISDSTFVQNSAPNNSGGALYLNNVSNDVNIRGTQFIQNSAMTGGGALYISGSSAFINFFESDFSENSANSGGAIYNGGNNGILHLDGGPTRSFFSDNTANSGGAILSTDINTSIELEHMDLVSNKAITSAGGALQVLSGPITIQDCGFAYNEALAGTAGALEISLSSSITIEDSWFIENRADLNGGALNFLMASNINILNTDFHGNISLTQNGGAITFNNSLNIQIQEGSFLNNRTDLQNGGAIYSDTSDLKIQNSDFLDNTAPLSDGGAIFALNGNLMISNNSQLIRNIAGDSGGALYLQDNDNVAIETLFLENSAFTGGAFYLNGGNGGYTLFAADYFMNNTSTGAGGGVGSIYNFIAPDNLLFYTNMFQGNNGYEAGGLYFSDTDASLVQNIFYKNNGTSSSTSTGSISATTTGAPRSINVFNIIFFENRGQGALKATDILAGNTASVALSNSVFHWRTAPPAVYVSNDPGGSFSAADCLFYPDVPLTRPEIGVQSNLQWTNPPLFQGNLNTPEGPDGELGTNDDPFRPQNNSPLINMGSVYPGSLTTLLTNSGITILEDVLGNPRVNHGNIDIGPYEYNGPDLSAPVPGGGTFAMEVEQLGNDTRIRWQSANDDVYCNTYGPQGQLEYRIAYSTTNINSLAQAQSASDLKSWFFADTPNAILYDSSLKVFESTVSNTLSAPYNFISGTPYFITVLVRDPEGKESYYPINVLNF